MWSVKRCGWFRGIILESPGGISMRLVDVVLVSLVCIAVVVRNLIVFDNYESSIKRQLILNQIFLHNNQS